MINKNINNMFKNPVKVVNDFEIKTHPDPYVIRHNGIYYAYATSHQGVQVLRSIDLVEWTHLGYALKTEGEKEYWAPAVIYNNGVFYMYYSSMQKEEADCHYEYMKVAISDKPEGPFKYVKTLYDNFTIDAHVIKDNTGDFYLLYSSNAEKGTDEYRPGTSILIDKLVDMYTVEGNPKLIIEPSIDQEIYERNRFGDGRDWHTIEGAFYIKRNNKHYVLYSGNAFTNEDYFIGYSVADDKGQADLRDLSFSKYPNEKTYCPILRKNSRVEGTGHNSVINAPNMIDDYIVYHGRDIEENSDNTIERRVMRIDEIMWANDHIVINGPSYEEQLIPAKSDMGILFNKEYKYEEKSKIGEFELGENELVQVSTVGKTQLTYESLSKNYILETSLKWNKNHMGGVYGVIINYQDKFNYTNIRFDVGARELDIIECTNGVHLKIASYKLEKSFRFDVYHTIRIYKTLNNIKINIDEMDIINCNLNNDFGDIGILGEYTSYSCGHINKVDIEELREDNTLVFSKILKAKSFENSKVILEKGIIKAKGKARSRVTIKDEFSKNSYKFSINILRKSNEKLTVYCLYKNIDEQVLLEVAKDKITIKNSKSGNDIDIELNDFRKERFTVNVVKDKQWISIHIDGRLVYENNNCNYSGIVGIDGNDFEVSDFKFYSFRVNK